LSLQCTSWFSAKRTMVVRQGGASRSVAIDDVTQESSSAFASTSSTAASSMSPSLPPSSTLPLCSQQVRLPSIQEGCLSPQCTSWLSPKRTIVVRQGEAS
jgi:hypothetical protein